MHEETDTYRKDRRGLGEGRTTRMPLDCCTSFGYWWKVVETDGARNVGISKRQEREHNKKESYSKYNIGK